MGINECSQPASKSSWDSQDFGDISMVLKMAHFRKSNGPRWVKSLNLYAICERRDYFLTTLMFKAIHGIVPHYLSDRIDMHFDIHGYDTREAGSKNVYLPTLHKEIYRNSFFSYSGGKLWNGLPDFVKNSTSIETFQRNYRIYRSLTKHESLSIKCGVNVFIAIIIIRPHCSVPCYA